MTKTGLQTALAEAVQTDRKSAGAFLDALSSIAYKAIKKNGEYVLPGFGKLVKQKGKARTGSAGVEVSLLSEIRLAVFGSERHLDSLSEPNTERS